MKASDLLAQLLQNRRAKSVGPDASAPPLAGAPAPLVQERKSPSLLTSGILGALKGTEQYYAAQGGGQPSPGDDFSYDHVRRTAEAQQGRTTGPFAGEEPQFGRPTAPRPSIGTPTLPPERREEKPFLDIPDKVRTRFGLLPGYRRGGQMEEGVPAVVGEEEPEVVIPRQPSIAVPISEVLRAVQSGQQAPVAEVAKAPEAAAPTLPVPTPLAPVSPPATTPRVDPAPGQNLADLGIPEDAALRKEGAGVDGAGVSYAGGGAPRAGTSRAVLDAVEALRAQRDQAASREVKDDDGRLKSAGKAALYGGVAALGATGDWRAALAGAATGAGVGAIRPQFDDEVERQREVEGLDQKIARTGEQAKEAVELEGKQADNAYKEAQAKDLEGKGERDALDRLWSRFITLYNDADEVSPEKTPQLYRIASRLGVTPDPKVRKEDGVYEWDRATGAKVFIPKGGAARPVMGADGRAFVDPTEKATKFNGYDVSQKEAASASATAEDRRLTREERAEERRQEEERRAREDRIKALETDVSRDDALGAEADKAAAETNEALEKLRAAVAARDLAAGNLDRLRKLREDEGDDGATAADVTKAEGELEKARLAAAALHTRVGKLSNRNKERYPGLFEQDEENWTARRTSGRMTESFIRLQGLRRNKSDDEIQATVEDARKRGLLR